LERGRDWKSGILWGIEGEKEVGRTEGERMWGLRERKTQE
jgi:hypothetical protein